MLGVVGGDPWLNYCSSLCVHSVSTLMPPWDCMHARSRLCVCVYVRE